MLRTTPQEIRPGSMDLGAGAALASPALAWLWRHLQDICNPHILDCGPVKPATVEVLIRRGAKLYVVDLISPALRADPIFWNRSRKSPVFRLEDFLAQVPSIPPGSLSAVFCWHLLDLLPREPLPGVVERFSSYLHPGGALFCLVREPYLAAGPETAWWLEGLTQLAREAGGTRPFPYPALTNRDMERLAPAGSVKTFLTRLGRREILVIKHPASGPH